MGEPCFGRERGGRPFPPRPGEVVADGGVQGGRVGAGPGGRGPVWVGDEGPVDGLGARGGMGERMRE